MTLFDKSLGLPLRVAARYQKAFEFATPNALKQYLHDHPGADTSKHTVKKPEHKEKGHADEGGAEKPKKSWKDVMKSLSSKALDFVKKAPEQVKKFATDEKFRYETLYKAHDAITKAPAQFVESAFKEAKHEIKEFKTAGEGIGAWMKGKPMTKEQKHAFKKVATHVAIATAAGALGAGLGAGAAALGKSIGGAFFSSTAKKIAIKAVAKRLEHLPTFEELGHIGHHGAELLHHFTEHLASEDQERDPEEVMQMLIAAAVAKELKDFDPGTLQEAIEEAASEAA